ncbi:MAG: undecaprenyl-diphosphate phosphatase [Clostridia bacterium]|nr:undecaprenyl-diphosphate phosphatase [Clostridia bacterium]
MPIWLAIIMGIVQGFTEFLPVSSSGHLALVQNIVDFEAYMSSHIVFDIALHLGTLVSVVIAFWDDIKFLFVSGLDWVRHGFKIEKHEGRNTVFMLFIATLPLIVAYLVKDYIESAFQNPVLIGFALLYTAAILYISDKVNGGKKTGGTVTIKDALVIGIMQMIAVLPGVSRSGSTMTAGLFTGLKRDFAVKFAFLLSIPAVLGATVTSIPDVLAMTWTGNDIVTFLIGIVCAAVSGYFAIFMVRKIAASKNFRYFAYYCACAGIVAIILGMMGII